MKTDERFDELYQKMVFEFRNDLEKKRKQALKENSKNYTVLVIMLIIDFIILALMMANGIKYFSINVVLIVFFIMVFLEILFWYEMFQNKTRFI